MRHLVLLATLLFAATAQAQTRACESDARIPGVVFGDCLRVCWDRGDTLTLTDNSGGKRWSFDELVSPAEICTGTEIGHEYELRVSLEDSISEPTTFKRDINPDRNGDGRVGFADLAAFDGFAEFGAVGRYWGWCVEGGIAVECPE